MLPLCEEVSPGLALYVVLVGAIYTITAILYGRAKFFTTSVNSS